jgi:hypothetical protein
MVHDQASGLNSVWRDYWPSQIAAAAVAVAVHRAVVRADAVGLNRLAASRIQ